MSDREWASTNAGRGAIAAIAALAVSTLVALWTLVHAIRIQPVPQLSAPQFAGTGALAMPAAAPAINVASVVETDPFAADRSAPAQRYVAPGEEGDETAPTPEAPGPEPVVLGTAFSDATHSFATVQLGDDRSVILHEGDKIGEYTVKSIGRGRVVFTTPAGKLLDLPALKP